MKNFNIKILMGAFLLTFLSAGVRASTGLEEECSSKALPVELYRYIIFHMREVDKARFRQTCWNAKFEVDKDIKVRIENHLQQFSDIGLPELNFTQRYTRFLIEEVISLCLQKDGYLYVPQGSLLEGYLSKRKKRLGFYDFFKQELAWSKELYSALFGKEMPEDKIDLAITMLNICLPINHIYVDHDKDSSVCRVNFKAKYGFKLLTTLKIMSVQKYFLIGIDTDPHLLNQAPYFIVLNQSQTEHPDFIAIKQFMQAVHNHTLIYNAEEEELSFPWPPEQIGQLRLTNINNKCTSIEESFLANCHGLTSLDIIDLINVTSIGACFLNNCTRLISLNPRGLTKVTSIGTLFLYRCHGLTSFDTRSFTNLASIGDSFLAGCYGLISLDSQGFSNVTSIGTLFLAGCYGLISLDTQGFSNVTLIRDNFLAGCPRLISLDMQGFSRVTSIGKGFLANGHGLISLDTRGLTKVKSIGGWFLSNCKTLITLDTRGLTKVTSIGESFLLETPLSAQAESIKREILQRGNLNQD